LLATAKLKKYSAITVGVAALILLGTKVRSGSPEAPAPLAISQQKPLVEQIAEFLPALPAEMAVANSQSAELVANNQPLTVSAEVPDPLAGGATPQSGGASAALRPQSPKARVSISPTTPPPADKISKALRSSPGATSTPALVAYRLSKPAGNPIAQRYQSIAQRTGYIETYPEVAAAELVDYHGQSLAADSAEAFERMRIAAANDGVTLKVISGFRSIATQVSIFDGKGGGLAAAEYSAPPGHSQHHTGLAVDINSLSPSFKKTKAFAWLRKNAKTYGFMLPYTEGSGDLGPRAEPWHWVYVGKPAAMKLMANFVERALKLTHDPFLGDRKLEKIYRSVG
jgi:LAS superfamily LD-carboxypeptidase LdcB